MLEFALSYRSALDTITGEREVKLWQYKLSESDWGIVEQLQDLLKVRCSIKIMKIRHDTYRSVL